MALRRRILVVEDDAELAGMISGYLTQQGFDTAVESRGERAADRVVREDPDLVVLDLMLPGEDGLSICRKIRPAFRGAILMLTARGEEANEISGLETGADDYLAKPVRPRVLLARIRALLRRPGRGDRESEPEGAIEIGELIVDPASREASVRGVRLELTSTEYDLLWVLVSHAGQVLRRDYLVELLRGEAYDGIDRSIDLRISKLRQKIGDDPRDPRLIKTVRGVGYTFAQVR